MQCRWSQLFGWKLQQIFHQIQVKKQQNLSEQFIRGCFLVQKEKLWLRLLKIEASTLTAWMYITGIISQY